MTTIATLFGGFGGVDVGAKAAGLQPAWSVEYDVAIAEVAAANFDHRVHVANLLDCNPRCFEAVDVLHASPPCPNFSVAKAGGAETALDLALARKVTEFVTVLRPRVFTLENVWAYRHSRSWTIIEDALHAAGYWIHVDHVNAADYSVPQTRKRMIVRAVRGGFVPYLPEPEPWLGWYEAIEDLLPALPDSQFAPWQLARLPEQLRASFLMQVQGEAGDGVRYEHEPMQTVTVAHGAGKYRAFLVDSKNVNQEYGKLHRTDEELGFTVVTDGKPSHMPRAWLIGDQERQVAAETRPSFTVRAGENGGGAPRAWLADGANTTEDQLSFWRDSDPALTVTSGGPKQPLRSLLNSGHVVSMTTRALARFQSFPDWYQFSGNSRLDAKGIGNAVPPLLYQRIIAPLLEAL